MTTLEEPVTAAEANREFSRLLRAVREGRSYVVTSHGRPVAKIVPVTETSQGNVAARDILLARLRSQKTMNIGPWTREELYEDADEVGAR